MSTDEGAATPLPHLPWRYLATGGPVDVRRRHRSDAPARTTPLSLSTASVISRLIILYVRLTRRVVIRGAFPTTGCVAVSIHRSYWDGLLLCMLDARTTAITSSAWRSIRVVGWYLEAYGVIWAGEHAVTRAIRHVREGGICWVAPGGFIRPGPAAPVHTGAAQIAKACGAPIVCVTLKEERRAGALVRRIGRRRLTILIGGPWVAAEDESVETITEKLATELRAAAR